MKRSLSRETLRGKINGIRPCQTTGMVIVSVGTFMLHCRQLLLLHLYLLPTKNGISGKALITLERLACSQHMPAIKFLRRRKKKVRDWHGKSAREALSSRTVRSRKDVFTYKRPTAITKKIV